MNAPDQSRCRNRVRSGFAAISLLLWCSYAAATSIATAARDADVGAVRAQLAAGADVNAPDADGTPALLWAAYQSSPELVSMLLAAGADANASSRFGVTPLLQASRYGDAATMRVLLAGGARAAPKVTEMRGPLQVLCRVPGCGVALRTEEGCVVSHSARSRQCGATTDWRGAA